MSLDTKIAQARRAYLGIEADPRLTGRIAARIAAASRRPATPYWIPLGVAAAALAAIVLALRPQSPPMQSPAHGRLALSLPTAPGTLRTPQGARPKLPSLIRIRALPVMPPTPSRKKPAPRTDTANSAASSV